MSCYDIYIYIYICVCVCVCVCPQINVNKCSTFEHLQKDKKHSNSLKGVSCLSDQFTKYLAKYIKNVMYLQDLYSTLVIKKQILQLCCFNEFTVNFYMQSSLFGTDQTRPLLQPAIY